MLTTTSESDHPSSPKSMSSSSQTPSCSSGTSLKLHSPSPISPESLHPNNVYSEDHPHPKWLISPGSEIADTDDFEHSGKYATGGFHPVVLGQIFNGRYTIVHKLGTGGFATVWLAWDRIQHQYIALKINSAKESERMTELSMYQYLQDFDTDLARHFICPLLDHFSHQGPQGRHLCLVFPVAGMPVTEGIRLSQSKMDHEANALAHQYSAQLAHALAFLHSCGVVHGDPTSSNILMSLCPLPKYSFDELYDLTLGPILVQPPYGASKICKYLVGSAWLQDLPIKNSILLVDFGEAFHISKPPSRGLATPLLYASPEAVLCGEYSPAADLWGLGCLLLEWYGSCELFSSSDLKGIVEEWISVLGSLPQSCWAEYVWRMQRNGETKIFPECDSSGSSLYEVVEDALNISKASRANTTQPAVSFQKIQEEMHAFFSHPLPHISISAGIEDSKMSFSPILSTSDAASAAPVNYESAQLYFQSPLRDPLSAKSAAAVFHSLVAQLITYHPGKRLPAMLVLQHPWYLPRSRPSNDQREYQRAGFGTAENGGWGAKLDLSLDLDSRIWYYERLSEHNLK